MKMTSRLALVAAAATLFGAYSANAADLGGGCCADLEERVAELEATTARKGNRVVSLQVYGNVSRGILFYDFKDDGALDGTGFPADDTNSDTVLIDEDGSKFGLRGSASLKPGWTAGYNIEISTSGEVDEAINLRKNNIWIESEQLGRVSLGLIASATDGIADISLANTYSNSGDFLPGEAFSNDISYGALGGGRGDFLRYDSPSIAGFIISTAWSNDPDTSDAVGTEDYFDVALRYAGEFNAFRIAAGIGYRDDEVGDEAIVGSASVMHVPSGLFLGYQAGDSEDTAEEYWYVTAGIEKNYFGYGNTTLYGEYGQYEDDDDDTLWGVGLTQSFDSAALDLYAQYRHVEEDDGSQEFDTFLLGTNIKF